MGHHHHHHHHGPPTRVDRIVGLLCGAGLPLLSGLIMAPVGIHQLVKGDPNMESFGWSFTVIGLLLVIIGAVMTGVLWPERKAPATDDE